MEFYGHNAFKIISPVGLTVLTDPSLYDVYAASADGNVWGFTLNSGTGSLTPIPGSPFHANGTLRDIVGGVDEQICVEATELRVDRGERPEPTAEDRLVTEHAQAVFGHGHLHRVL